MSEALKENIQLWSEAR